MSVPVTEHAVPAGPLAVRWLSYRLPPVRAGSVSLALVELENAGSVPWDSRDGTGICIGYHWLDPLANPIVWDGLLSAFPKVVAPGERIAVEMTVAGPIPPGRYRIALDLVDGDRCWFEEVGNTRLELDATVSPRLSKRTLAVRISPGPGELAGLTRRALAAQEEPVQEEGEVVAFLAAGVEPKPDWSRRLLDAHDQGYAAASGSVSVRGGRVARRRLRAQVAPWSPGAGHRPGWSLPLICPSLVEELLPKVRWLEPVAGLPAVAAPDFPDRWIWDGRISVFVSARALRPGGRPPA